MRTFILLLAISAVAIAQKTGYKPYGNHTYYENPFGQPRILSEGKCGEGEVFDHFELDGAIYGHCLPRLGGNLQVCPKPPKFACGVRTNDFLVFPVSPLSFAGPSFWRCR